MSSVSKILVRHLIIDHVAENIQRKVFFYKSLPLFQALCFAALGVSFMVMSLSFIIIDWTTGAGLAAGGH